MTHREPPAREAILARLGFTAGSRDGSVSPLAFYGREGAGPHLLALHGLGDSALTFAEFLASEPLRRFPVLAPDVPGFGWSARRAGATSELRSQANWVLEFLDDMGVASFVVLGHSMGGAVAVHLAELAPERCRGILNIEGNLTYADCSLSAEAVEADREGRYDAWRETVVTRVLFEAEAWRAEGELRFADTFPLSHPLTYLESSYGLVDESLGARLGERYRALEVPRLYIHGGMSSPPETQDFIRDHGQPESFHPEARHWPHWDARDAVAGDCARFLADIRAKPG